MARTNYHLIPTGSEQSERLSTALKEGYFNVDEMSFEDLLAASTDFASSLKFINDSAVENGSWRSFLASNVIVIMALIVHRDTTSTRKELATGRLSNPRKIFVLQLSLINDFDQWLTGLERSDTTQARDLVIDLHKLLYGGLIAQAHNLGVLLDICKTFDESLSDIDFPNVGDIWEITSMESTLGSEKIFSRASIVDGLDKAAALQLLRKIGFGLLNSLEHLKSQCRSLLPKALKTQSHDPAISVFIAFIKLYSYAQDSANTFTRRHLDFYYEEILKTQIRSKVPETAVVNFEVVDGSGPVEIEAGRQFSCGKDENLKNILFQSEETILVTDAKIASIHTLRFSREHMIAPECYLGFVTRLQCSDIPIDNDSGDHGLKKGYPIFGGFSTNLSSHSTLHNNASIHKDKFLPFGISVSSRILILEEGRRKLTLEITLDEKAKSLSFHLSSLLESRTRSEFKKVLFHFLLEWKSVKHNYDLEKALSHDIADQIKDCASRVENLTSLTAEEKNRRESLQSISCADLFLQAITHLKKGSSLSETLYLALINSDSKQEFTFWLGEIIRYYLFGRVEFSSGLDDKINHVARELNCIRSLNVVENELKLGRDRLFQKYLGSAFHIKLSTESGWLSIDRYDVSGNESQEPGFRLVFSIPTEAPPIKNCSADSHGEMWCTKLPTLRLDFNAEAPVNAYSLLAHYGLEEIRIKAEVYGVRNVTVFNNISQLDPSKPFYPFGPIPTTNSYFALGSQEAASKPIDAIRINLQWGELPTGEEGFYGHYQGYPSRYRNDVFSARVNILNSGIWRPTALNHMQETKLFTSVGNKVSSHHVINVDAVEYLSPIPLDELKDTFNLGLQTRGGFIKVSLSGPESAFGHQQYPVKLTETLEQNSKKRASKKTKLPKMPYTPLINSLSIDYIASTRISLRSGLPEEAGKYTDEVRRSHPFGVEKIYPTKGSMGNDFFKPFNADGNLLIGISASDAPHRLNLYFDMMDPPIQNKMAPPINLNWSFLSGAEWIPLSRDKIVHDGTKGFLCSGLITLLLPDGISNDHRDMINGLYWIRVSTNEPSTHFCNLHRIKTHAVTLKRAADGANFNRKNIFESRVVWSPLSSITGISSISQLGAFNQVREDESKDQRNARVAERIRHRARAINSWDYERLLLEEFPTIGKVACFPNCSYSSSAPSPGKLLLVVTPKVSHAEMVQFGTPKLSAVDLRDVYEYIKSVAPPFADIEITNPRYEWIQVRCGVVFEELGQRTNYIELLNRDLNSYLNPFIPLGYELDFGKQIKRDDIYSYIYNQNYVRFVTELSLLKVTRNENGFYSLEDTVSEEGIDAGSELVPDKPWGLLMPMEKHHIALLSKLESRPPKMTGIRDLEINRTFIVGGI